MLNFIQRHEETDELEPRTSTLVKRKNSLAHPFGVSAGKFGQPRGKPWTGPQNKYARVTCAPLQQNTPPGITKCLLLENFRKQFLEGTVSADGFLPIGNVGFVIGELAPIAKKAVKIPWVFAHMVEDFSLRFFPTCLSKTDKAFDKVADLT